MELFRKLFASLNRGSVKYMIAGGVAVNLYGIERSTADIDIVLKLEKTNVLKFVKLAKRLGLKPKVPVKLDDFADPEKRDSWISEKGMAVFGLYDPKTPFFLIDIFVEDPFDFDEVYRRRKKIRSEVAVIPVVPIQELILMKEKSNRPQDRADVFHLRKIMKDWKDEKKKR
jgi:hypothetical protein